MKPDLPAVTALQRGGVGHEVVEFGRVSTLDEAAALQNLPSHRVMKTMVVRRGDDDFIFVLVPGDRVIDWQALRAMLGVSRLSLADSSDVSQATGYEPGAITPIGSSFEWPVVADSALDTPSFISIGSGRPGTAIHIDGESLISFLAAEVGPVTKPSADS